MCSSAAENLAKYFCIRHIQHVTSSKYYTYFFLFFIIYIYYMLILGVVQQITGSKTYYNRYNHCVDHLFFIFLIFAVI